MLQQFGQLWDVMPDDFKKSFAEIPPDGLILK
jgi:hypothetical protein